MALKKAVRRGWNVVANKTSHDYDQEEDEESLTNSEEEARILSNGRRRGMEITRRSKSINVV
jgi:hypothetical protein